MLVIQRQPMGLRTVAAHLRTFLRECGSFARTIFPGKHIHLRKQFSQVKVTFMHIRFFQVIVCLFAQDCIDKLSPHFQFKL